MAQVPKPYAELAEWWPLLSAPEEYADEAAEYRRIILDAVDGDVGHVLELGSGGGNNASHLKTAFAMTLVDRSPAMLAVSRRLNPELEHLEGDMRTVRLGRTFDAVFAELDEHLCGLFPRRTWLDGLRDAGFDDVRPVDLRGDEARVGTLGFVGVRRD